MEVHCILIYHLKRHVAGLQGRRGRGGEDVCEGGGGAGEEGCVGGRGMRKRAGVETKMTRWYSGE